MKKSKLFKIVSGCMLAAAIYSSPVAAQSFFAPSPIGTIGGTNVGVGIGNPDATFHVMGSPFTPTVQHVSRITDNTAVQLGLPLNTALAQTVIDNSANLFEIDRWDPTQYSGSGPVAAYTLRSLFSVNLGGNVAIGTDRYDERLNIDGNIKIIGAGHDLILSDGQYLSEILCDQLWCTNTIINRSMNAYINGEGNFKVGNGNYTNTGSIEVIHSDQNKWNFVAMNSAGLGKCIRAIGGWEGNSQPLMQIETAVGGQALTQEGIVRFKVQSDGMVGINTNNPQSELEVHGTITACEVIVQNPGWCDYVFEEDYDLAGLDEVEKYINENKHLPDVPSAEEVENGGVNLGEMDAILLKKIEELTLYTITMNKKMDLLEKENRELRQKLNH